MDHSLKVEHIGCYLSTKNGNEVKLLLLFWALLIDSVEREMAQIVKTILFLIKAYKSRMAQKKRVTFQVKNTKFSGLGKTFLVKN